jgi:Flp pilus assembly protein TadG
LKRGERGSATVESTFAVLLLSFLVLGTIEVAFALYGRNVLMTSAHEAARAAVELGRSQGEAETIARETALSTAGGIIEGMKVAVDMTESGSLAIFAVRVEGTVDAWGPIPFPFAVTSVARATTDRLRRRAKRAVRR